MTLDYSQCSPADQADKLKQDRTNTFFDLIKKTETLDAELIQLVQEGICLEVRDENGQTPLIHAVKNGHTDIVKALIEKGAKLEASDKSGWTPLIHATYNGHTDIVKALIEKSAKLEASDESGLTPLIIAVIHDNIDAVKPLIESGANLEVRDRYGFTALIIAANNNDDKIATLLLERGANVYARERMGGRPINYPFVQDMVRGWQKAYDDFAENATAPKDKTELYHLLAVTPLLNEKAPVDTIDNLRKIMLRAKWDDMNVALEILSGLVKDCAIRPEDAADIQSSIIAKGPERLIKKTQSSGMGI